MPLVLDAMKSLTGDVFTAKQVQESLAERHGIAMPHEILSSCLRRAARKGVVRRETGHYRRASEGRVTVDLLGIRVDAERRQRAMAEALQTYARGRGVSIDSEEAALAALFGFLEEQQVALILSRDVRASEDDSGGHSMRVVAEFVQNSLTEANGPHRETLRSILEGLVVYRSTFLTPMSPPSRKFKDLKVFSTPGS
jgi:hypothetical protein